MVRPFWTLQALILLIFTTHSKSKNEIFSIPCLEQLNDKPIKMHGTISTVC